MNHLAFACVDNAEHLVQAARILFKNKFYGYSVALAALAIEECGKGFASSPLEDFQNELPRDFKSHSKKLHWASFDNFFSGLAQKGLFSVSDPVTLEEYQARFLKYLEARNKDFLELLGESSVYKYLHVMKMTGLYVDVKDGKTLTPRIIKRKQSAFIIKLAEKRIAAFWKEHGSYRT